MNPNKSLRAETEFFSRGITLSKNHQTMTKLELDLHNSKMYPYTKFELNVCRATVQEITNGNQLWNDKG
jgi:hypothetical protein